MKFRLCIGALTFALVFAVPARANPTEFSVTINAFWDASSYCISAPFCPSSPNPVVDRLRATFDEYANGTVVPGTMHFTFTNSYSIDFGVMSFGPPPACPLGGPGCGPGFPGHTTLPGQQMWSDSQGYFVDFVPPGWPPTGSETLSATQATAASVYGATVLGIDCVGVDCESMFACYSDLCAQGGDAPASGGTITIIPVQAETPEPSTLLLLTCGVPLLFLLRRSMQSDLTS